VGYPNTWTNYDAIELTPGQLAENVLQLRQFAQEENARRLNSAFDPDLFDLIISTIGGYYEQKRNVMYFPVGILLLPLFNADDTASTALNYGGIGS
jgi:putative endopeptidase